MFGIVGAALKAYNVTMDIIGKIMGWNRDQAIKQTGIDAQRGQDLEAQNKILKDELAAQTNSPPDVAGVVDVARKGGL